MTPALALALRAIRGAGAEPTLDPQAQRLAIDLGQGRAVPVAAVASAIPHVYAPHLPDGGALALCHGGAVAGVLLTPEAWANLLSQAAHGRPEHRALLAQYDQRTRAALTAMDAAAHLSDGAGGPAVLP